MIGRIKAWEMLGGGWLLLDGGFLLDHGVLSSWGGQLGHGL
jgi:hypothetical protein